MTTPLGNILLLCEVVSRVLFDHELESGFADGVFFGRVGASIVRSIGLVAGLHHKYNFTHCTAITMYAVTAF